MQVATLILHPLAKQKLITIFLAHLSLNLEQNGTSYQHAGAQTDSLNISDKESMRNITGKTYRTFKKQVTLQCGQNYRSIFETQRKTSISVT